MKFEEGRGLNMKKSGGGGGTGPYPPRIRPCNGLYGYSGPWHAGGCGQSIQPGD